MRWCRQLLAGGGRVVERELVQDQHTQRDGNDAYQQRQPVDS